MADAFRVEVIGTDDAQRFLKLKEQAVNNALGVALQEVAFFMESEVKESVAGRRAEPTSVDTGRFLNDIHGVVDGESAVIFSPLDYPIHLEYGTVNMAGRWHFRNSLERNRKKIVDFFREEMKKL